MVRTEQESLSNSTRRARVSDDNRTRKAVLDAARQVVETYGYAGTTAARITKLAGCSRPTFYVYFSSKDDVFRVLAQEAQQEFLAAQEVDSRSVVNDPVDVAMATVGAYLDVYVRHYKFLVVLEHQALADEDARTIFGQIHDHAVTRAVRYMQGLTESRIASPVLDLSKIARATTGMIHAAARVVVLDPSRRDEEVKSLVIAHLQLLGIASACTVNEKKGDD